MACVSPLRVLNPTKNYLRGKHKFFLDVPCGKCYGCRKSMQSDWFVRSFFQTEETRLSGGATYMFTLTYNNSHLPYFGHFLNIAELENIPCFCKDDVITFLDSFRHYFRRSYGVDGIKYLICSEYGENTQRPHYHLLFHFPKYFNPNYIYKIVQRYWRFGFSYLSRNKNSGSGVVSGNFACRYVGKYITKDLNFLGIPALSQFVDDDNYKDVLKPFLPFHLQSKGYGSSICDLVTSDPVGCFTKGIRIPYVNKCYKVPQYIINKLCYSYNEDGSRFLNDFGVQVKSIQFDKILDYETQRLHHACTYLGWQNLSSSFSDLSCYCSSCDSLDGYKGHSGYVCLKNLLGSRSFRSLAFYKLFLCNKEFPRSLSHLHFVSDFDSNFDKLKSFYLSSLGQNTLTNRSVSYKIARSSPFLFNSLPMFKDFDRILSILKSVEFDFNTSKNNFSQTNDFYVNKIRQSFCEH